MMLSEEQGAVPVLCVPALGEGMQQDTGMLLQSPH